MSWICLEYDHRQKYLVTKKWCFKTNFRWKICTFVSMCYINLMSTVDANLMFEVDIITFSFFDVNLTSFAHWVIIIRTNTLRQTSWTCFECLWKEILLVGWLLKFIHHFINFLPSCIHPPLSCYCIIIHYSLQRTIGIFTPSYRLSSVCNRIRIIGWTVDVKETFVCDVIPKKDTFISKINCKYTVLSTMSLWWSIHINDLYTITIIIQDICRE